MKKFFIMAICAMALMSVNAQATEMAILLENDSVMIENDSVLVENDSILIEGDSIEIENDSILGVVDSIPAEKDSVEIENGRKIARLYTAENAYEHWTDGDKNTEYLRVTGLRLGLGVSGQYLTNHFGGWEKGAISPMGVVSLELDGRGWWFHTDTLKEDIVTITGDYLPAGTVIRDPVRLFSYELDVAIGPRWYNMTSENGTVGMVYVAFDTNFYLKVRLWESPFANTRVNFMLGPGYTYRQHEHLLELGQWKSIEDGGVKELKQPVEYQASGLRAAAGVAVSIRPQHSADKCELRLLATYNPYNTYGVTTMKWGLELGFQYHIAMGKSWHIK